MQLASALSALNRVEEAFEPFERAVALGYGNRRWAESDPDLSAFRATSRGSELVARIPAVPLAMKPFARQPRRPRASRAQPATLPAVPSSLPSPLPALTIGGPAFLPTEWRLAFVDGGENLNEALLCGYASVGHRTVARIVRHRAVARGLWLLELEGVCALPGDPPDGSGTVPAAAAKLLAERFAALLPHYPEADALVEARLGLKPNAAQLAYLIGGSLPFEEPLRCALLRAKTVEERFQIASLVVEALEARVRLLPAVRCPVCSSAPPEGARWYCTSVCRCAFHTFATRGVCPRCGYRHGLAWCLICQQPSPHADWYLAA